MTTDEPLEEEGGEESDSEEEIFEYSMDFNPGAVPLLDSSDHTSSELSRDEPASSPSLSR